MLVEGLASVRSIAADGRHSLAVTQSRDVFQWGKSFRPEAEPSLRPIVAGLKGVRVRRVCAGRETAFAIGEDGELFSWGSGGDGLLGHGDRHSQRSPKRVEALQDILVSSVAVGSFHALALAEDGLVYAWWGKDLGGAAILCTLNAVIQLLPTPVEALRGRMGSIVATGFRSYVLADTGELWAWGVDGPQRAPLGHGEQVPGRMPKPIESLRGIKVDAVVAADRAMLALTDDGSVYACSAWALQ
jgi:alpha-tubulin suppressor-like RCC1 family protein